MNASFLCTLTHAIPNSYVLIKNITFTTDLIKLLIKTVLSF